MYYEHTEIQNIIHRNATVSDGYTTLYEIMEQINWVLNQVAKLPQPTSLNCNDIHEYYRQYDSYLLHNHFMGVHFNTCRKVHLFIKGLDPTYDIAIHRMQQQMMIWKKDDPVPPDDLQILVLSRTVEKITMETTDTPRYAPSPDNSPFLSICQMTAELWGMETEELSNLHEKKDAPACYLMVYCWFSVWLWKENCTWSAYLFNMV